jgi:hypothetical protein
MIKKITSQFVTVKTRMVDGCVKVLELCIQVDITNKRQSLMAKIKKFTFKDNKINKPEYADINIPQDYKKYKGFKPCFGYVYLVENRTDKPCQFNVLVEELTVVVEDDKKTCSVYFYAQNVTGTIGLVTVEGGITDILSPINEARKGSISMVAFLVKPMYKQRFIDRGNLKVVPFWVDGGKDFAFDFVGGYCPETRA